MRKYGSMLLIAIVLQAGIYFYLDRVVLMPAASFSQQTIIDESKLPVNPEHVTYDHKYYVELQPQGLVFYANSGMIAEIPIQAEETVTYFSWVPETHQALIGISKSISEGVILTLKSYDMDQASFRLDQQISDLANDSKIVSAAYSTQYNVTYVLVKNSTTSSIYRTDNNNVPFKAFTGSSVSRIALLQEKDLLLFDNNQGTAAVYTLSKQGKYRTISPREEQYALIGTDKNDHIYIGQLTSEGVISTILTGTLDGGFTESQSLENPYPVASITVSYDGTLTYH